MEQPSIVLLMESVENKTTVRKIVRLGFIGFGLMLTTLKMISNR